MSGFKAALPPQMDAEPFIPYVEEKDFTPALQALIGPYKQRMGFLPNALRLHAWRPEIAETLWKLNSLVMRDPSSTLDAFLKRRVGAICCSTNGCRYCTAHTCFMLKRKDPLSEGWGMADGEVQALVEGDLEPKNEMERACFDFARTASESPAAMPDEIYDRLKAHLTPAQVVELANVVGFWKYYNTLHDSLRIPVENALIPDTKYAQAV